MIFDAPKNGYLSHAVLLVRVDGWFTPYSSTALMCTLYTLILCTFSIRLVKVDYMARKETSGHYFYGKLGIIPLVPGGLAYDATKNFSLIKFRSTTINTMMDDCRGHRIKLIRRPNFQINCFWVREIF
ncbi:hypothetical protein ACVQ90_08575 [Staphylococcus aureus]